MEWISTGELLSTDPEGESQNPTDIGLKPRLELPSLPAIGIDGPRNRTEGVGAFR